MHIQSTRRAGDRPQGPEIKVVKREKIGVLTTTSLITHENLSSFLTNLPLSTFSLILIQVCKAKIFLNKTSTLFLELSPLGTGNNFRLKVHRNPLAFLSSSLHVHVLVLPSAVVSYSKLLKGPPVPLGFVLTEQHLLIKLKPLSYSRVFSAYGEREGVG